MACCPTEAKYGYDDSRFEKAVDDHLHCSICYNVLKEPMMCRNNEHLFCRDCITEHLNTNSHTCPECNEDLSIETLRRARVISNILSGLKIKCDYSHRGCHEYIRLEQLDSHVENCGFAPVKCSNEECEMIVNKLEIIHHESIVCEHRKVKCHNCVKIEKDVKEMKKKMDGMVNDIDDVKGFVVQIFEKLSILASPIQISAGMNHESLKEDVLVAGSMDSRGNYLKSVERFSWKKNVWEKTSLMNVGRKGATSFVYNNQVFVAGGCNSCVVEVLDLNEDELQWTESIARVPSLRGNLCSVVCQDRAVLFCTIGKADNCTELCLTAPYTCKQLCKMPEAPRKYYTMVAFEHKVLIFGGTNASEFDPFDGVLQFDIDTKEFNVMPALPNRVNTMAGLRWGDKAVLIGYFNKDGPSKKVLMYDSKTGKTTKLPSMLEKRSACAAVITGNTIVVMGGKGPAGRVSSVEAFTFGGYSWRYLPSMNDIRSVPTATVLPTKNFH